jgi:bacterioferritin-associated ferredoxin
MIVCHCASVTDRDIHQLIRAGARSVKEIVQQSGAGRRCAPCRDAIASLLATEPLPLFAD